MKRWIKLWFAVVGCWLLGGRLAGQAPTNEASPAPTNRISVAILGFHNQTTNAALSHWRYALKILVGEELRAVSDIRLRYRDGILYAHRQLQKRIGDPIDAKEARQMGEAIEARRVVWGDYTVENGKWKVSGGVMNVATGAIIKNIQAVSSNWFDISDQVTEQILAALKVTPSEAERSKMRIRGTASPVALEWLCKAEEARDGSDSQIEEEQFARRAIEAEPDSVSGYVTLASALIGQEKWDAGEEASTKATRLRPEDFRGHLTLAHVLALRGRASGAEAAAKVARRLAPEDAGVALKLAELYQSEGAEALSIAEFKRSIALDPYIAVVHAELGGLYASLGKTKEAAAELAEAERLSSGADFGAEQSISHARLLLHDSPGAIRHIERSISLATRMAMGPKAIEHSRKQLEELKAREAPVRFNVPEPKAYSPHALQEEFRARLSPEELAVAVNPLASNLEMFAWAYDLTRGATNDLQKARMLFDTLSKRANFSLGGVRTAQEAFTAWNHSEIPLLCQEHANLYVALARGVGLKAYFTAVDECADGRKAFHACAAVFVDGSALLVDPVFNWFGAPHKKFVIMDDLQAAACHLSQLLERNGPELRAAYKLAPDLAVVRLNYCCRLMKENHWDEAAQLVSPLLANTNDWTSALLAGYIAEHNRDLDRAINEYRRSAELSPAPEPQLALGFAYKTQGRLAEARGALRAALSRPLTGLEAGAARQAIADINEQLGDQPIAAAEAAEGVPGLGTDQDAARAGDPEAMVRLARRYEMGVGVPANTALAVEWFQKAAEKGNVDGMSGLGVFYFRGAPGLPPDYRKAVEWSRKAAEAGESDGMRNLGYSYIEGKGVEQDLAEGARWVRKSAEKDNPQAMVQLGWLFEHGRGVEQDYVQAMLWYRKAADKGDAAAMGHVGEMYARGEAVDRSDSQAARWIQKGADAGSVPAMHMLGVMYLEGHGLDKDPSQALTWLVKAADTGYADSMLYLGSMYFNGRGLARDPQKAIEWYRKAGEAGNGEGFYNLAYIYGNGAGVPKDDLKSVEWLRKGAEAGNGDSTAQLGEMYSQGRGVAKDEAEALRWYRKGAALSNARAMTDLGGMYEEGRAVDRNLTEARNWYRKAVEAGDDEAKKRLQKLADSQ